MIRMRSLLQNMVIGGALIIPAVGYAETSGSNSSALTLALPSASPIDGKSKDAADSQPTYLADAPAPEAPNIHGFFNSPFKSAYVTPRGLVVQNAGLVWQPIVGLVIPIGDAGPVKGLTLPPKTTQP